MNDSDGGGGSPPDPHASARGCSGLPDGAEQAAREGGRSEVVEDGVRAALENIVLNALANKPAGAERVLHLGAERAAQDPWPLTYVYLAQAAVSEPAFHGLLCLEAALLYARYLFDHRVRGESCHAPPQDSPFWALVERVEDFPELTAIFADFHVESACRQGDVTMWGWLNDRSPDVPISRREWEYLSLWPASFDPVLRERMQHEEPFAAFPRKGRPDFKDRYWTRLTMPRADGLKLCPWAAQLKPTAERAPTSQLVRDTPLIITKADGTAVTGDVARRMWIEAEIKLHEADDVSAQLHAEHVTRPAETTARLRRIVELRAELDALRNAPESPATTPQPNDPNPDAKADFAKTGEKPAKKTKLGKKDRIKAWIRGNADTVKGFTFKYQAVDHIHELNRRVIGKDTIGDALQEEGYVWETGRPAGS
jgi:hypothetical protein